MDLRSHGAQMLWLRCASPGQTPPGHRMWWGWGEAASVLPRPSVVCFSDANRFFTDGDVCDKV